jgi:hypothetical protein
VLKKSVFILVLLVLVLTCTFAKGTLGLSIKASPYSYQYVKRDGGYSSSYGFAAELGYRHYVWKGHSVGVDLKYENYKYDAITEHYHVISASIKAGWTQKFGEKWCLDAEAGFGIQGRKVDTAKDLFLALSVYVGGGYQVSEKVRLTLGASFEPTFQADSNDYAVCAMLGTLITL